MPDRIDASAIFAMEPVALARALIGARLTVEGVGGRIVETEAYRRDDPASHSFRGETPRNRAMFGPVGRAYVYRSYGLHWCFNIVCDAGEPGSAVLIRALEPLQGLDRMSERRRTTNPRLLCAGPGRLCQALGIDASHDGRPLDVEPFGFTPRTDPVPLVEGPRIGITRGVEMIWRFGAAGSPFLSRRFPDARAA